PTGRLDVVLLDEDRVVQSGPVVGAAARCDRALLELAQARRRLARVEDLRAGALDSADEARGERRDAGEPAEEVERDALSLQDRRRAAPDLGDGAAFAPLALGDARLPPKLTVDRLEHGARHVEPGDDPSRLLLDDGPGASVRRHQRVGRYVAHANVLGERAFDQLARLR